jgi:hypothetical protein
VKTKTEPESDAPCSAMALLRLVLVDTDNAYVGLACACPSAVKTISRANAPKEKLDSFRIFNKLSPDEFFAGYRRRRLEGLREAGWLSGLTTNLEGQDSRY